MICPNYKREVIGALLKAEGPRRLRQLLEYDYDIGQIMKCDERQCTRWEECKGMMFSLAPLEEDEERD